MTKVTEDDKKLAQVMRHAGHPMMEIAVTLGVSERTVRRILKNVEVPESVPQASSIHMSGIFERMGSEYVNAVLQGMYYERRIEADPDNPKWHEFHLRYAQLRRSILADLAANRGLATADDDTWDVILHDRLPDTVY